jgi:hypothetical protein
MRLSRAVGSRLSLAFIIVASTLAITCASGTRIPNEPVQLANIRNVEAKLDRVLAAGIRGGLIGGRTAIVADEMATRNETGEVDESGRIRIFTRRLRYFRVTGPELTVSDLQRLRSALHLRVDEAYAARGDLAKFSDLSSLSVGADAIAHSLNAPAGLGR